MITKEALYQLIFWVGIYHTIKWAARKLA